MKFEIIKVLIIMVIVFAAFFIVSYLLDKKQEKENEKNGVEKQDKNYGTIEYSINDKTVSLVQARGFSNKNISDVCSDELMQIQKLLQSKISA
jgi:flagellar basal body-associated protein FliL